MVGKIQRIVLAAVILIVVCATVPAPTVAATSDISESTEHTLWDSSPALQIAENNSTTHHVDPENTTEEGDLLQVRGWLSGQLAGQLSQSAIEINQGQYEAGRSLIGDQYDSRLKQLVDVTGETGSDEDDVLGETFGDTQRTQGDFSNTAEEYERTYEEYQEAVENENESAARRYARELQNTEERLQHLNRSLIENYTQLGNQTGIDFTEAVSSISNLSKNVSTRQARVIADTFTGTRLQVTGESALISYEDPLVASGQLVTEEGSPISGREVTLRIGEQMKQVRTDDDGRFSLQYRPRTIAADTGSLSIRYVPRTNSQYFGSNTSLAVTVEQVEANLTILALPSSTAFGDRFDVETRLTFNGEPVSDIPVEASFSGYQLEERVTATNGSSIVRGVIPASLRAGQQNLRVGVPLQGRAVTAAAVSTPVSVRSTNTTLSVQGERFDASSIRISGELTTENGLAVPEQGVLVSIGDSVQRSVETNQGGTYTLFINQSELPDGTNSSVVVSVAYNSQGTNLRSTSITDEIEFEPFTESNVQGGNEGGTLPSENEQGGNEGGTLPGGSPVVDLGLPVVVTATVGGVLLVLYRRYDRSPRPNQEGGTRPTGESTGRGEEKQQALDLSQGESLVDESPETAILWAYHTLREYLAVLTGAEDSDTHWEFYQKCREQGIDQEQLSQLRELIEAYEAVRFQNPLNTELEVQKLIEDLDSDNWSEIETTKQ